MSLTHDGYTFRQLYQPKEITREGAAIQVVRLEKTPLHKLLDEREREHKSILELIDIQTERTRKAEAKDRGFTLIYGR